MIVIFNEPCLIVEYIYNPRNDVHYTAYGSVVLVQAEALGSVHTSFKNSTIRSCQIAINVMDALMNAPILY